MTADGGFPEGDRPATGKAEVEAALDQVVRDFGRMLSRKPDRLRHLLNDVLGANASRVSDEIDAVVAAAESGVTDQVLSGGSTDEGYERLIGTGIEPGLAGWALASWTRTLRADTFPTATTVPAEPGLDDRTVAPDPDATVAPPAPVGAGPSYETVLPLDADATVLPEPPNGSAPLPPPPGDTAGSGRGPTRKVGLIIAAAAALLVLAGGAAMALTNDDPDEVAVWTRDRGDATTPVDTEPDDPTPSTTVAPGPSAKAKSAAVNMGDDLTATRTLELFDDTLTVVTRYKNTGSKAFNGQIVEAIPPALVDKDVTFTPKPDGHLGTLAYNFRARIRPGKTFEIEARYEGVNPDWTNKNLKDVIEQFTAARFSWFVNGPGDKTPPVAKITSPGPGASVQAAEITVTGTTEVGTTVKINGQPARVDNKGNFSGTVALVVGVNPITVEATDGNNNTKTAKQNVTRTPAPDPGNGGSGGNTDPDPGDGGSGGNTDPDPGNGGNTDPDPDPDPGNGGNTDPDPTPKNRAPVLNCGNESITLTPVSTWGWFHVDQSCFSDPDGDTVTAFAQVQSGGGSTATNNSSCSRWCWYYYPPAGYSGAPYQAVVYVYATDSHGAKTAYSMKLTLCINC